MAVGNCQEEPNLSKYLSHPEEVVWGDYCLQKQKGMYYYLRDSNSKFRFFSIDHISQNTIV